MTADMSEIKSKLLAVIERAQVDQAALVAQLSDAEKAAVGEPDHWAAKDQIAHLNFWRDDALRRLIALRDGVPAPDPIEDDDDVVNARVFARYQSTSWRELLWESDRLLREAKQVAPQLSDEQLAETSRTASGDEFTCAERFVSTFFEHPSDHLAQVYRERGDSARAQEQERATVQVIGELLGRHSTIYGHATYNLGCFYARTGETAQAIAAIRAALRLIPELVEFSRHDAELDALHEIPAFQALYTH